MGREVYTTLRGGMFGGLCALAAAGCASAGTLAQPGPAEIPHTQPSANDAQRLLMSHNAERARLGLPPLTRNPTLARDASRYARAILSRGVFEHASQTERKGQGENLWIGTVGAWNAAGMVQMFLDERRHFRPAPFPNVSSTGQWSDVGHYTQIVWRETREVGCAIDTGKGQDVLVCRYLPAGNVMGQKPY